jgi:hypothetical protein
VDALHYEKKCHGKFERAGTLLSGRQSFGCPKLLQQQHDSLSREDEGRQYIELQEDLSEGLQVASTVPQVSRGIQAPSQLDGNRKELGRHP